MHKEIERKMERWWSVGVLGRL